MPNLKDIRNQISSITSTRQITSAMKMVSAAKLRKAQNAIVQMRPYAIKLNAILENLCSSLDGNIENVYTEKRTENKILVVAVSSNRGLCGAFNTNVVKQINSLISEKYATQFANGNVHFVTIGRKITDTLIRRKFVVVNSYTSVYELLNFEKVFPIADTLMNLFANKQYDKIIIVYNRFKNAGIQYITEESFLPIEIIPTTKGTKSIDYILEPSGEVIIEKVIPKSLSIQLYKILLDSVASEHGARMTSMHKATDNASEMIKDLKQIYNKARQASITKEIIEIVSGAESLRL